MIPLFGLFRIPLFVLFKLFFDPFVDRRVMSKVLAGLFKRQFPLRPCLLEILVLPNPLAQRITDVDMPQTPEIVTEPIFELAKYSGSSLSQ